MVGLEESEAEMYIPMLPTSPSPLPLLHPSPGELPKDEFPREVGTGDREASGVKVYRERAMSRKEEGSFGSRG